MRLATNRSPSWAFMQKLEIPDYDGDGNYLTRLRLVQTPWFGVYLHRFDGPDPRLTLHDHPWPFVSLVLLGGYVEADSYSTTQHLPVNWESVDDIPKESLRVHGSWSTLRRWAVNRKRPTDVHAIVALLRKPTWTLMLVGRRQRVWGYVEPDGTWTAFDEHPHNLEFLAAMERRGK